MVELWMISTGRLFFPRRAVGLLRRVVGILRDSTFVPTCSKMRKGVLLFVGSMVVSTISLSAQLEGLIRRNPFGEAPVVVSEPKRVTEAIKGIEEVVEFGGSYSLGLERKFSLLFREVGQERWMCKLDSFQGVTVVDYYEDEQVLIVDYRGNTGRLKLRDRSLMARNADPRRVAPARTPIPTPSVRSRPNPPSFRPESKTPPSVLPQRVPKPENLPPPPKRVPRNRGSALSA